MCTTKKRKKTNLAILFHNTNSARDKLEETNREVVVRRRNSKVTPVHQFGKPAQFTKRTITRTVSFSN